jgi:hypothetical protein
MASCRSGHADNGEADAFKRKLTYSQDAQTLFNSLELQEEEEKKEKKEKIQINPPTQSLTPQQHTVRIEVPESDISLVVSGGTFTIERQTRQQHIWKMELPTLDDVFATDLLDDWFHRFQTNNRLFTADRRPPQHLILTKNNSFRFGACIAPVNLLLWQAYETGLCLNVDTFQLKADSGDLDPKQWLQISFLDRNDILRNKCKHQFHTFIREIVTAHSK